MIQKQTIIETIQKRKSVRTFEPRGLTEQDFQRIEDYLQQPENLLGFMGGEVKLQIIQVTAGVTNKGIKLGTYGFIKNPQAYIVGISENSPWAMVEFGYIFEKMVLFLTEMNIGTCWLGGTFTRTSFEQEINLRGDEVVPCITPIGYPRDKQRLLFDKTLRYVVKADRKKEWEDLYYADSFATKLTKEAADWAATPLDMVRLAPSASNKQPWRVVMSADSKQVHFYLAHTPGYTKENASYDIQRVDMGIAFCHFELACKAANLTGTWKINAPIVAIPDTHTEYVASWELEDDQF
ncbi:MAG: nitroreductase family protein [Gorillibacterium sp.]|nr:nitroreductase family protein [Gorillibacterium sp.]